jgi:rod shape-determining protein MreB
LKPRTFQLRQLFSTDLGIDLGTLHTSLWRPGDGVVVDEPSLVAVEHGSRRVLNHGSAVGHLAKVMQGRTPESIQTICPMRDGVVADVELCAAMLRHFMHKAQPRAWGFRPRVLLAVPSGMTPVERQAVLATATRAGARQVFLIAKTLAAALGAGLPLNEPEAGMLGDLGGGTSELAVLCLGDIAVSESLRVAGSSMDQAIADYLRRCHKLRVSQQMAEWIKVTIGSAAPLDPELTLEVRGCDAITGLPRQITVRSEEVREALGDPVRAIVQAVERTLQRCRPELSADLMETGIVLCGGGSLLRGIDRRLAEATGMPVRVIDDPQTCVIRGLGACLEHLEAWHGLIQRQQAA